jgi:hypothetical protein
MAPGFAFLAVMTLPSASVQHGDLQRVNRFCSSLSPIPIREISSPFQITESTARRWRYVRHVSRTRQTQPFLDAIAVMKPPWQPTVTGVEEPERLNGQRERTCFHVLGVQPVVGRSFMAAEDLPGGECRDPQRQIVAAAIRSRSNHRGPRHHLDDERYTVLASCRGFENVLSPSAELWTSLQYNPALSLRGREWGTICEWWRVFVQSRVFLAGRR